jgi:diacylglycerol kinase family enzyme
MSFYGKYAGRPPRVMVEARGQPIEGVTAVVQNSDPFTYFRSQPIRVCEGAALDNGTLSATVLRRARQRDVPPLAWKLLTGRGSVGDHSEIASLAGLSDVRVTALERDGRPLPFPLQVDGDYVGHHTEVSFTVRPGALRVLA